MGTEIHLHIEIELNGIWEHWHTPKINCWYQLFGRLAGVRHPDEPHIKPRGIPSNITKPTTWDYDNSFGHTASWLTWQEFQKIQAWVEQEHEVYSRPGHGWHTVIGYLGGNGYQPYSDITNIRFIFWFDC